MIELDLDILLDSTSKRLKVQDQDPTPINKYVQTGITGINNSEEDNSDANEEKIRKYRKISKSKATNNQLEENQRIAELNKQKEEQLKLNYQFFGDAIIGLDPGNDRISKWLKKEGLIVQQQIDKFNERMKEVVLGTVNE